MPQIKLSACMIVKNEKNVLMRCLESLKGEVDEIVIVDTGSTDGTDEIARLYADVYEQRIFDPWDFSEARNYSMDLATGNRILIIDADEWVSEGWEHIHEAVQREHFIVGSIQVINTTRQGAIIGEVVTQPRLFRNEYDDGSAKSLRYYNKVHNQIDDRVISYSQEYYEHTGVRGFAVGVGAKIMHTGYDLTPDQVLTKYTPRLDILRRQISEAKEKGDARESSYYEFQLALMLHMVFSDEDALPIWETLEFGNLNAFNRWYAHYIASRAFLKFGDMQNAAHHCGGMYAAMKAEGDPIPHEPATYVISGVVLCESGDLCGGLLMMIEGYFLNLDPPYGVRCVMDADHLKRDIVDYLSKVDRGEALRLKAARDNAQTYNTLRHIQRNLEASDQNLLDLVER